jgi:hypothetical protein
VVRVARQQRWRITYTDAEGVSTERTVRPMSMVDGVLTAWCETRQAMRTFRLDRIRTASLEETGEIIDMAEALRLLAGHEGQRETDRARQRSPASWATHGVDGMTAGPWVAPDPADPPEAAPMTEARRGSLGPVGALVLAAAAAVVGWIACAAQTSPGKPEPAPIAAAAPSASDPIAVAKAASLLEQATDPTVRVAAACILGRQVPGVRAPMPRQRQCVQAFEQHGLLEGSIHPAIKP